MSIKKRGLGRGLEALLSNASSPPKEKRPLPIKTLQKSNHLSSVATDADELQVVTPVVTMPDTLEPVVTQKIAENSAEIIAIEGSWQAGRLAGLQELPGVLKERDEREALAIALIENLQQENLNLVQEAEDLKKLIDEFEAMVRRL
ncbi:MAG: ParB N-terminal domain-containing protein [Methylococcaceae bacterium]